LNVPQSRKEKDTGDTKAEWNKNAGEACHGDVDHLFSQKGEIHLESCHEQEEEHAYLDHGLPAQYGGGARLEQPLVGIWEKRTENRRSQKYAPNQFPEYGGLVEPPHKVPKDECEGEHDANLQEEEDHVVLIHIMGASFNHIFLIS
jgi:hypothetical protein